MLSYVLVPCKQCHYIFFHSSFGVNFCNRLSKSHRFCLWQRFFLVYVSCLAAANDVLVYIHAVLPNYFFSVELFAFLASTKPHTFLSGLLTANLINGPVISLAKETRFVHSTSVYIIVIYMILEAEFLIITTLSKSRIFWDHNLKFSKQNSNLLCNFKSFKIFNHYEALERVPKTKISFFIV